MNSASKRSPAVAAGAARDAGISRYATSQTPELAAVCQGLRAEIEATLPRAESKIWHGAPVWFLEGYPVVGYSIKAGKVSLLFWNGRALGEPALQPVGKHFAAELVFTEVSELDRAAIRRMLVRAGQHVFKDYAALRGKRGTKPTRQRKPQRTP
ncbi:MAG: DUF1801 domain-containing protein [Verrucomicrobia bacterium]|nr:DUF1801 domain-containing protein [Verrucomicrobiota bacterium]